MRKLKVLVACEFSGRVRDAFTALGHNAISCDLLPSETPGKHYQGDAIRFINENVDADLLICHPPCEKLSYAGYGSWYKEGRVRERIKAATFFLDLFESPISHICIENPRGIMTELFRPADQEIHPYFFGEKALKRTQLWLKNLPPLQYALTENLLFPKTASDKPEPLFITRDRKTGKMKRRHFTDSISSGHNQYRIRSATFPVIANAMANQWSEYLTSKLIAS